MTDPSMTPETPGIAETAHFLRRFADLMSVGQNATYLHHAAVLLEDLMARLTAALDEEQLWRYKYETIAQHADELETECGALKNDIDGHLDILSSTVTERDTLKATLQGRETELSGLRGEIAAKSQAHQDALAEIRGAFDRERQALNAAAEARGKELDQLRQQLAEQARARETELSEFRRDFAHERDDLAARLKVSGDELAALRIVSEREHEALRAKVASLEAKRAELRSAFDRISQLKNQTVEPQDGAGRAVSAAPGPEAPSRPALAVGEADVVVPRATLRQVRSQFEYLANEFTFAGDVASQVMCELGAFTMELALGAGRKADPLPVGDVALSILASPGSAAPVGAGTR
ncbi:hypothetical protein KMZ29_02675 [Bradyrhizobium sediminis]|uniref:Uncharacterized protein n=1 Tax=Bradyrhizobium sediminis TaxID=2840469 RepID=A0A975NEI9_9BRAD|nr:hypothetical protein [Bradyrhizobium sediminis]QWG13658.1 hypothetical protein KMZ29_02675 [Bradyrhizobium sediminis]